MKKIVLAIFFALFIFSSLGYFFYKNQLTSTITVSGQVEKEFSVGEISLIVTKGNAAAEINSAINTNDTEVKRLISVIKQIGGPESEIKKSFYQVTPNDNQYIVASALGVTIKKPINLDILVRQLYLAGATNISNISMIPVNKDTAESELRKEAVDKAAKNASEISKSIGKSIKRIVSIVDDQQSPSSSITPDGKSEAVISINKNVTVVYEIW